MSSEEKHIRATCASVVERYSTENWRQYFRGVAITETGINLFIKSPLPPVLAPPEVIDGVAITTIFSSREKKYDA